MMHNFQKTISFRRLPTGSESSCENSMDSCEPSTTGPPSVLDASVSHEICDPSTSVFGDIPPTNSDETAKALVESVRIAFDAAREAYWAGQPGPYVLEGKWSLATFEALASTLESKWRLAFYENRITLFGDPKDVHERVTDLIASEVQQGVEWGTHMETPAILQGL
jgi:hypothetical protein